ncbi:glycosyltransferase family 4 protein [Oceanibium sediminis]|uniref:glycosyltransferase family 4 protein n=1 Tax=Oceanibium sediminis TaxID=2026339 RepID=UPI000DD324A8|nr:glycosyltransferase family 4 protein [Oceanibium sediminis]
MSPPPPPCPAHTAPPADALPPDLWVLGAFGMTGGHMAMHTAQTVAAALEGGARVRCISLHPGAFAEGDVARLPAGMDAAPSAGQPRGRYPAGVIYLRSLCRMAGPGRLRRAVFWLRRLRQARALARSTGQLVLIHDGAGHPAGARVLQALLSLWVGFGHPCASRVPLATPPALLLSANLGLSPGSQTAEQAESVMFRHIQTDGHAELRLTDTHVARALLLPEALSLPPDTRADILDLARRARTLQGRDVEAAMRQATFNPAGDAPRALRAAFAVAESGLPAIAQHLRIIGKRRRHWMRFVPPDARACWTAPGLEGAVLRHLANHRMQAGDLAHLRGLARPLFDGPGAPSRLDWFLCLALRVPVEQASSLRAPWRCAHLANRLAQACPPRQRDRAAPPRLTVAGFAANGTGLSQNFWMSVHALQLAGISPTLAPTDTQAGHLETLQQPETPQRRLMRDVTLYHLNADRIPQEILADQPNAGRYNIGFLLWELDRVPAAHRLALKMLDEIWVPSVYLKRLYQGQFDGEVVLMRKGLVLPPPDTAKVPEKRGTRFVICFDERSSVARKNPLAGVRAFQAAFAAGESAELIVKSTPAPPGHRGDPERQMDEIRRLAARDKRITLIESHLPFPALLGLIASADALLSPHRAEGFGYLPAFALSLKVPVIATDHGGCRDFLSEDTAFPLPHDLVPVPRGHAIHRTPGARWAEVCVPSMAAAMQALHRDPAPAREKARRGQLLMQTDYSLGAQAERYVQRLETLGLVETLAAPVSLAGSALD